MSFFPVAPMSTPDAPAWWTNPPHDEVLRFSAGVRLDGVTVQLGIDGDGSPRFIATFPTDPRGRAVALDARTLPAAVAEIDCRWPPSPWATEPDKLPPDVVDLGGGDMRIPFMFGGDDKQPILSIVSRSERSGGEWSGRALTEPIHFAAFRLLGMEIGIAGKGARITVEQLNVNGDANMLIAPETIVVPPDANEHVVELRRFRMYPPLDRGNIAVASFRRFDADGPAYVKIAAIVRRTVGG